jgi:hypothetical protein
MFGWFRKEPRLVRENDQICWSRAVADQELVSSAVGYLDLGAPLIVASFFRGSLLRMEGALQQAACTPRWLEPRSLPALPLAETLRRPWLLHAAGLSFDLAVSSWLLRAELPFRLFFVEHYPTFDAEHAALDVLEQCSVKVPLTVRFHGDLDDRLFGVFGGERVRGLMQALGLEPEEKIAHPLVDRSIINAPKEARQARAERAARRHRSGVVRAEPRARLMRRR